MVKPRAQRRGNAHDQLDAQELGERLSTSELALGEVVEEDETVKSDRDDHKVEAAARGVGKFKSVRNEDRADQGTRRRRTQGRAPQSRQSTGLDRADRSPRRLC